MHSAVKQYSKLPATAVEARDRLKQTCSQQCI